MYRVICSLAGNSHREVHMKFFINEDGHFIILQYSKSFAKNFFLC